MPPGVLYLVKASYKYQAEDVDELAFEVGEVINIVEYEDPEDQVFMMNWYITSQEGAAESFHDWMRTLHNNGWELLCVDKPTVSGRAERSKASQKHSGWVNIEKFEAIVV